MQALFNFKNILLIAIFLLQITNQASASPILGFNRFMTASSQITDSGWNALWSAPSQSSTYSLIFEHTIQPAKRVYYSTRGIDGHIYNWLYRISGNGDKISLIYQIKMVSVSETSLSTVIYGYFAWKILTLQYLLVFTNPLENDYVVLQQFWFNKGYNYHSIALPSKYTAGHSLSYSIQIGDIKMQFLQSQLNSQNNDFFIQYDASIAGTALDITLKVPPYFQTSAYLYSIRYIAIIIDFTALLEDYPHYPFEINTTSTTKSSEPINVNYSLSSNNSNYMFGLSQVRFKLDRDPSFNFDLTINYPKTVTYEFKGHRDGITEYSYSYAAFIYAICVTTVSYTLYNLTDHKCYDACQLNYYFDPITEICKVCRYDCLTCRIYSQCLSCDTTYRHLQNLNCISNNGYFESFAPIPYNCSSPCRSCLNNDTFCTSCPLNNSMLLINDTCISCGIIFQGCSICTMSHCKSCLPAYKLINSTFCNRVCTDTNCAICSNSNTSHCYLCVNRSFTLNEYSFCRQASAACGNGIIEIGENCDDGNANNRDGCSSDCIVEPDYRCYRNSSLGYNKTYYCTYTLPIDFTLVSVQKLDYSNELTIIISISQYQQQFWNTQSTLSQSIFQKKVPYKHMRAEFLNPNRQIHSTKLAQILASSYPQDSLMKITFEYTETIHDQQVKLSFNFNSSTDLALVQIPSSSIQFTVNPENNHFAHLYTEKIYKYQKLLSNYFYGITIVSLALMILSLGVGGKRIIIQMLVVMQVTYVSLLTVPNISPLLSSITTLSTASNGYNILYNPLLRPFQDSLNDKSAKGAQLYSQFLFNINVGLLFVFLPLIIGIAVYIFSKIKETSQETTKKIHSIYRLAIGQYTFIGLMFTGTIVGASAVLQIKFGTKEVKSTIGLSSIIFTFIMVIFYLVYIILRKNYENCFSEYRQVIKPNTTYSLVFQIIYFLFGLTTGSIISTLYKFKYINCLICGIALTIYVLTLAKPIFKKSIDMYRTQLNLLSISLIQVAFLYSNIHTNFQYYNENDLVIMMPMIVAFIILINFICNFLFFIYILGKKVKKYSDKEPKEQAKETKQEQLYQSKKTQEFKSLYKNSLINPLNYINKPRFANGFILQDDEQIDFSFQPMREKILLNKQRINNIEKQTQNIVKEQLFDDA